MMSIQEKLYTADELWELSNLPENRDKRFELSEGMLIEMSPGIGEHGDIIAIITGFFFNFVIPNQLGRLSGAETGYVLQKNAGSKDTVRAPDLGFVRAERMQGHKRLPKRYVPFAPDLAVEVISPNDKQVEIEEKIGQYLRAGTTMVMIVDVDNEIIYVHTPSESRRLTMDDTLDGGDVLPGFSLPVRTIFET